MNARNTSQSSAAFTVSQAQLHRRHHLLKILRIRQAVVLPVRNKVDQILRINIIEIKRKLIKIKRIRVVRDHGQGDLIECCLIKFLRGEFKIN